MRVVVAQKGAREHFLAARALHRRGLLAQLVVDWYTPDNQMLRWAMARVGGGRGRAGLGAQAPEIPPGMVRPHRLKSLLWKSVERAASLAGREYAGYARTDAGFARAVAALALPPHDVFFSYSYSSLEALESERARGVVTVLGQIDPGPVEFRMVAEEMRRHPELAGPPGRFPSGHYDRLRREWEVADVIVANSEWSRQGLLAEGADPSRVQVVPLAYETGTGAHDASPPCEPSLPLRVLWLGQVNVRKGIHHLIEAARLMDPRTVEFVVAGPVGVRPDVVTQAPANMRWLGAIPRGEVGALYRNTHVFVLPTLSDGFAITQLEALAHGVPVVTTPNCARVIEHGVTGFIVPPRDPPALAQALQTFVQNPSLAWAMAPACRASAATYSIDVYGRRLGGVIKTQIDCAR